MQDCEALSVGVESEHCAVTVCSTRIGYPVQSVLRQSYPGDGATFASSKIMQIGKTRAICSESEHCASPIATIGRCPIYHIASDNKSSLRSASIGCKIKTMDVRKGRAI